MFFDSIMISQFNNLIDYSKLFIMIFNINYIKIGVKYNQFLTSPNKFLVINTNQKNARIRLYTIHIIKLQS